MHAFLLLIFLVNLVTAALPGAPPGGPAGAAAAQAAQLQPAAGAAVACNGALRNGPLPQVARECIPAPAPHWGVPILAPLPLLPLGVWAPGTPGAHYPPLPPPPTPPAPVSALATPRVAVVLLLFAVALWMCVRAAAPAPSRFSGCRPPFPIGPAAAAALLRVAAAPASRASLGLGARPTRMWRGGAALRALLAGAALARGGAQEWAVTTLAGSGAGAGSSAGAFADGSGAEASFNSPYGLAIDSNGDVFVADSGNHAIRRVTPGGVVSTYVWGRDLGMERGLNGPQGVAVDAGGALFVADTQHSLIKKVAPGPLMTALAGGRFRDGSSPDGTGFGASFYGPSGLAVDASGNVLVADRFHNRIRVVTSDGVVSTLAGSDMQTFADGVGADASFSWPQGLAVDSSGHVIVADSYNHRIRLITPGGAVSTLAGSGWAAFADGAGAAASFSTPQSVAIDASGNAIVADTNNQRIRRVTPGGVVSTLAGSMAYEASGSFADGTGAAASFFYPSGVAIGADGTIFVADRFNHRIRVLSAVSVSPTPSVTTPASATASSTSTASALTATSTRGATSTGTTPGDVPLLFMDTACAPSPIQTANIFGTSSQVALAFKASASTAVSIKSVSLCLGGGSFSGTLTVALHTTQASGSYLPSAIVAGTSTATGALSVATSPYVWTTLTLATPIAVPRGTARYALVINGASTTIKWGSAASASIWGWPVLGQAAPCADPCVFRATSGTWTAFSASLGFNLAGALLPPTGTATASGTASGAPGSAAASATAAASAAASETTAATLSQTGTTSAAGSLAGTLTASQTAAATRPPTQSAAQSQTGNASAAGTQTASQTGTATAAATRPPTQSAAQSQTGTASAAAIAVATLSALPTVAATTAVQSPTVTATSTALRSAAETAPPAQATAPTALCPAGFFCPHATNATPCPAGSFSAAIGATSVSTCVSCGAGKFSGSGAAVCSPCAAGSFSASSGTTAASGCLSCPAGKFSAAASSALNMCVEPLYSTGVNDAGVTLFQGTYDPHWGGVMHHNSAWAHPPAGFEGGWLGGTSVQPGWTTYRTTFFVWDVADASISGLWGCDNSCFIYLNGAFYASLSGEYNFYPLNEFTLNTGFIAGINSFEWRVFNMGDRASPGGVIGIFTRVAGAFSSRASCAAGMYAPEGAVFCSYCPEGTFSAAAGASIPATCTPCPAGTWSNATGAASNATCTNCAAGMFSTAGAATCNVIAPTASPAPSATSTTTASRSAAGTAPPTQTAMPTGTVSAAASQSAVKSNSAFAANTAIATATPTATAVATPTATRTATRSNAEPSAPLMRTSTQTAAANSEPIPPPPAPSITPAPNPPGAPCALDAACATGPCRAGFCCAPSAARANCSACTPFTGACALQPPGEPCASNADCGTDLCAGGCCCASSAVRVPGCAACACWANASTTAATAGACLSSGGGDGGGGGSCGGGGGGATTINNYYNINSDAHVVINAGGAPAAAPRHCPACDAFDAAQLVEGLFILPGGHPLSPSPGVDLAVGLPGSCASLSAAASAQGVPAAEAAAMLPCLTRPTFLLIDGANYTVLGSAAALRLAALPEDCAAGENSAGAPAGGAGAWPSDPPPPSIYPSARASASLSGSAPVTASSSGSPSDSPSGVPSTSTSVSASASRSPGASPSESPSASFSGSPMASVMPPLPGA
jgi:sugar lactone lactonase YvrE